MSACTRSSIASFGAPRVEEKELEGSSFAALKEEREFGKVTLEWVDRLKCDFVPPTIFSIPKASATSILRGPCDGNWRKGPPGPACGFVIPARAHKAGADDVLR